MAFSSFGDWLGLLATTALAQQLAGLLSSASKDETTPTLAHWVSKGELPY
jgi:hypothetical protein